MKKSKTNEFKLFPVKYKESLFEISKSDISEKSLLEDISSVEELSDLDDDFGTPLDEYCNRIDLGMVSTEINVISKVALPKKKKNKVEIKKKFNKFVIKRRVKRRHCFYPDMEILKNLKLE